MNRRTFLQGAIGNSLAAMGISLADEPLPSPQNSGIDHIIVVTMENRSFDHFLGWLPNADGIPSGLTFKTASGSSHAPQSFSGDYTGCGHPGPNDSYGAANLTAYNNGNMDGFLKVPGNDIYSISYYSAKDNPFLAALAEAFTTCDHWFAPFLGDTYPNRFFLWAAQTDRQTNTLSLTNLPTIFDRLSSAHVSHRYYFSNVPFLAFWGLKYLNISSDFDDFLHDVGSNNLPAVSFVDPRFTILNDGLGNDDHPNSDIRNGDAFLSQVFHALATGPNWSSTVLIVIFDEWGGFFDHVAPPRVIAPNGVDTNLVNGQALLGFRVPAIIASPFTRGANRVDSTVYDHTAVLKLIEWRWGLDPLTARDASPAIGNPAARFNFTSPDASVPSLPQRGTVTGLPCFLRGWGLEATTPNLQSQTTTEFGALASSQLVRDWQNTSRFRQLQ